MPSNFDRVGEFHEKFGLHTVGSVPVGFVDESTFRFRKKFLQEELDEFESSHNKRDIAGVADALADLAYVVYGTAHMYGIPLDDVFREVHRKNMQKERSTGEDDGRSKRGSSLDVVKPEGWTPPDIQKVLDDWSDRWKTRHADEFYGAGIDPKWVRRFMDLARTVSSWSKDPTTQVGAVLVGNDRGEVAVGYNGFPRGIADLDDRLNDRDKKLALMQHAERNVLDNARFDVWGATLYCTQIPCSECTKSIISKSIGVVVCPPSPTKEPWASDSVLSKAMMAEVGIKLVEV